MPAPTLRAAGLVTLVIAALFGSAYALGRSLMPEPDHSTGLQASVSNSHNPDQPPGQDFPGPGPGRPNPSPSASASAQASGDGEGPYGSLISTGSSRIALTFDDGPDPRYTPQVLELLKEYGVKATFCVVGQNAKDHPDLIQAIAADGHTLCNHSWSHDVNLGKRSPDTIRADLLRTSDAIHAAAPDARIAYFRQPGGAWTSPIVSTCKELGMAPLHWAVDPSDWKAPGAAKIISAVMSQVGPGSIVLMHDAGGDRTGTIEALQRLLPQLMDRYRLEALPVGTT